MNSVQCIATEQEAANQAEAVFNAKLSEAKLNVKVRHRLSGCVPLCLRPRVESVIQGNDNMSGHMNCHWNSFHHVHMAFIIIATPKAYQLCWVSPEDGATDRIHPSDHN